MAKNLSAIAKNLDTLSEKEARWAGWDPEMEVPVVEMLGYEVSAGSARLNRVGVSANGYLLVSGSTGGGGTVTLDADASNNRVSSFSDDAGLMRVSAVGGSTVSLSADASGNRVSAIQADAGNLRVSAFLASQLDAGNDSISAKSDNASTLRVSGFSNDAALFRVSAVGTTVVPLSADSSSVSAKQESAANLRVSAFSDSAALFRVSALGVTLATAQTLSATLKEGTSFVGNVSAKNTDAANFHVSAKSDNASQARVSALNMDAALMRVSALQGPNYWSVSAYVDNGSVSAKSSEANQLHVSSFSQDAGLMRVSAIGGSSVSLSADASGNRVSAVQADAANLRVSARGTVTDGDSVDAGDRAFLVAGKNVNGDGNYFLRVNNTNYALLINGDTAHDDTDSVGYPVKIGGKAVSAIPDAVAHNDRVNAYFDQRGRQIVGSDDAATMRVSSIGGSSVSLSADASGNRVSAVQHDAGNLHVSAQVTNQVSATLLGTPNVGALQLTSPWVTQGTVSNSDAASLLVSAKTDSAAQFRTSAFVDSGSVSAKSGDAGNLRVSASLFPDTTGGLSIFQTLSVSASQNIKSTAGSIYGYFIANTDTKFNYVKFYNVSGAVNLGTDTPILTIPIPPSAAANVEFPHGLVGFTNGIGVAATSAVAINATSLPVASSVVVNLFYK